MLNHIRPVAAARGLLALSPIAVFLLLYVVVSVLIGDFYKMPMSIAFIVASMWGMALMRGMKLRERIEVFSTGAANSNILYLGAGNTLYYPSANMTINSFRAYFELNLTSGQQVKAINLNFGDEEAASIKTISESSDHSKDSDAYFTLDGRRLNDKPTQKGMYINNGRKVLIK